MRRMLLPVLLFAANHSMAQLSDPFKELKTYIKTQPPKMEIDTTPYLEMVYKKGNHYLLPLYKAFIQEQRGLARDAGFYYEVLAQAVSFLGDHKTVLAFEKASYETESLADSLKTDISKHADIAKDISYIDARQYILSQAKRNRVVMINEAHDKPQTRAFTASLLEDLYQQGFRTSQWKCSTMFHRKPF